ncbi:protein of unknown function [Anaerocolumna jejuensis DSM 15929]|uniref:DUF4352 domain-containing protein n=1 Tax=Anaerocolumna jejuensis DSM 15929 TaxID=1121322 RepID=A0A1M6MN40_9FIRM|nr:DUF4352 domain-containing protein [Anaerocolumna jejuensis]SHJ84901.1 protein of unknown function [Anaerocolumna jejuensis DSM 15929]
MKKTFLVLVLACGLLLTGCAQLTKLTDKQSDVIAEYMAGSVLRYTDNYMEALVYPEDKGTDDKQTLDKMSDKASDTSKDAASEATKNSQSGNAADAAAKDNSANSTSKDAKNANKLNYQEFYKNLSDNTYQVKYTGFKLYDSYAQRDNYFTLQPTGGRKLLIMSFEVKNDTKKAIKMNLGKIHIDYKLNLADGKSYKPMVTLLDTDLNYLNYTLKSGKSDDAVLVFDVPKDLNSEGLTLSISLNGQNTAIDLNE